MTQQSTVIYTMPFEATSFTLKIVAIIGMTCNHMGYIFYEHLPFTAQCILIGAGGLTFPIMAFLLTEGYHYTSNVRKYGIRLAIFALISQIPFWLFLSHTGNVLFTLLIGLVLLYLYDHMKNRVAFWALVLVGIAISYFCDWGVVGIVLILAFKVMRGERGGITIPLLIPIMAFSLPALSALISEANLAYLPELLYPLVGTSLTIPLIASYRGKRGRAMKYFFYAYYPAHIAVLGVLYLLLGF